jgi:hypothetical protein
MLFWGDTILNCAQTQENLNRTELFWIATLLKI